MVRSIHSSVRTLAFTFLLGSLLLPGAHSQAAQAKPAFLQPEVLKAALAINLTEVQKPQFQAAVTEFFNGRMEAFNLLSRRHNQTGIPRKMKSRTKKLLKNMDESVASFLTPEQMPAYEHYRDTLKSKLR